MVEVFATSVQTREQADEILSAFQRLFPELQMNFDLEDCDKILRAEGSHIDPHQIISAIRQYDHACSILD